MTWIEGIYGILLRCCPPRYRARAAEDLRAGFEEALRDAPTPGERAWVATKEILDLARNLPGLWWEEKPMHPGIGQDVRIALRGLRSRPGFAAVVILLLALGIGANAGAFSVVHGILLESLPYPHADELVYMYESTPGGETRSVSYLNYRDWRERNHVFQAVGARTGWSFTLTGDGDAEDLSVRLVSASLAGVLGVEPAVGRFFTPQEEAREERVVVLSGELWTRRFGGDPSVVGRTITLDAEPWTVVGVMPPGQEFPLDDAQVLAPLTTLSASDRASRSSHPGISVIGRLRDGESLESAQADMDAVAANLAQEYPDANEGAGVVVSSLRERFLGGARPTLLLLAGAVALVLIIACANVANLLLARAGARGREAAVRAALGAGRARVARLFLVETLALSLIGGMMGVGLAYGLVWAFRLMGAGHLPRVSRIEVDGAVLLFTAVVSVVAALVVGLVPALRLAAGDPARELRAGSRGGGGGRRGRLRQALVAVEVALSFVLLVGGTLMARSMGNLLNADTGLDTDDVLTMYVPLPRAAYPGVEDRARFYDQVLARVRDLPEVVAAGAGDPLPLTGYNRQWHLSGEGLESVGPDGLRIDQSSVTPGYFAAMGIPLLAGRAFDRDDGADDPVAIIDETLAERLWPGESALGRVVRFSGNGPRVRIVGVVGHVRHYGVRIEGRGQIYLPHHLRVFGLSVVIHAPGATASLMPRVRRIVAGVDPDVPLDRIRTMASYRQEGLAAELLATRVLGAFGIAALFLAMLGLYGVVSYTVGQRTREIGIRMAMGAPLGGVVAAVTRQGLAMAAVGVSLGAAGAALATPVLRSLLFGVGPQDPLAMGLVAGLLLVVSALAALIPALRAGRVDPARTLRE